MINLYKKLFESTSFEVIQDLFRKIIVPIRKPRSVGKNDHDAMVRTQEFLYRYKELSESETAHLHKTEIDFIRNRVVNIFQHVRISNDEILSIYGSSYNRPDMIKGKFATYLKRDVGSYDRFLANINNLEYFFSTLKGFHAIPLNGLVVEFVSAKDMKVPARYRTERDVVWVNPLSKKVGNTIEEYGSLRYILLHELGHRYLKKKRQKWDITDPKLITTDYSSKNFMSMTEEEIFAELFAISHWPKKYREYEKQISEFEKRIE